MRGIHWPRLVFVEWMLQVVDEIDDAVGVLRLCVLGIAAETGLALTGAVGVGAIVAAVAAGAEGPLIYSATLLLGFAAALKFQSSRFPTRL